MEALVKGYTDDQLKEVMKLAKRELAHRVNKEMEKELDDKLKTVIGYKGCSVEYSFDDLGDSRSGDASSIEEVSVVLKIQDGEDIREISIDAYYMYRGDDDVVTRLDTSFGLINYSSRYGYEARDSLTKLDIDGWTLADTRKLLDTVIEVVTPFNSPSYSFHDYPKDWDLTTDVKLEEQGTKTAGDVFADVAALHEAHGFDDLEVVYSFTDDEEKCLLTVYSEGAASKCNISWNRHHNAFPDYIVDLIWQHTYDIIKVAMPVYGDLIVEAERQANSYAAESPPDTQDE